MDSVARAAGMSKAGVVHHFSSKRTLALAVLDHLIDSWVQALEQRAKTAGAKDEISRLRIYVQYAITGDFDLSDLALMSEVHFRTDLVAQWATRLDPWFGENIVASEPDKAALRAARALADGVWFNQSAGLTTYSPGERKAIAELALALIDQVAPDSTVLAGEK